MWQCWKMVKTSQNPDPQIRNPGTIGPQAKPRCLRKPDTPKPKPANHAACVDPRPRSLKHERYPKPLTQNLYAQHPLSQDLQKGGTHLRAPSVRRLLLGRSFDSFVRGFRVTEFLGFVAQVGSTVLVRGRGARTGRNNDERGNLKPFLLCTSHRSRP